MNGAAQPAGNETAEAAQPAAGLIDAADLDRAAAAFTGSYTQAASPWDEFRSRYLRLPDWFVHGLDPLSPEYAEQQDRLWQAISGRARPYQPDLNEQTPEIRDLDPLVRPGFYLGDTGSAGHHLIALGHIVKLSDIRPGDQVLEYGAGFGQIALAFARLGAQVDTVDINPDFCAAINAQAGWFNVPLRAHHGPFGFNPHPGTRYDLIIFYECFHHARDFLALIGQLHGLLSDRGKLLLAGEPIAQPGSPGLPYDWGMRLDMETTAVVRIRGWYEIGFQEEFLLRCFTRAGFTARKHPGVISHYATVYEFARHPKIVRLSVHPLSATEAATWHGPEVNGRWTTGRSLLHLDTATTWRTLAVTASNFHQKPVSLRWRLGQEDGEALLQPGERKVLTLLRTEDAATLTFSPETVVPRTYGIDDGRNLGIFIEQIEYQD